MDVWERGTGDAVLLLHGTPSPSTDWLPVAEQLASRFRVLVPDLPGYRGSPALSDPSMERIGDALLAMLHERGVHRLAAIGGYSTGAYRALELVLRHKLEVKLVIAIAGVTCFDQPGRDFRRELARRLELEPSYLDSAELRGVMPELMLSDAWRTDHPADVARVTDWPGITSAAALSGELAALANSRDLRPELRDLQASVYARVGDLDRGCPPGWSEELVQLVRDGALDIVPGCGHGLFIEDASGTAAAIMAQLNAL